MAPGSFRLAWCACVLGVVFGLEKLASPKECGSCMAPSYDDSSASDESVDGRRVAFVLRGESFRGLHMMMPKQVKRDTICLANSHEIQRAEAENHVANIIEPLEAAGTKVDVFLSTYGCVGTAWFSDVSDAEAERWHQDLIQWYGADRVKQGSKRVRNSQL